MRKLILLLFAALILMLDMGMSSCTMRVAKGTPYKVWTPGNRTKRHWGARRHFNQRRAIWGPRRYGPRPYDHRGRYR